MKIFTRNTKTFQTLLNVELTTNLPVSNASIVISPKFMVIQRESIASSVSANTTALKEITQRIPCCVQNVVWYLNWTKTKLADALGLLHLQKRRDIAWMKKTTNCI